MIEARKFYYELYIFPTILPRIPEFINYVRFGHKVTNMLVSNDSVD